MEDPQPINLGTNHEIKIKDLVEIIAKLVGFEGDIHWDTTKPDGQPRRRLDVTLAKKLLGWQAEVDLTDGLRRTVDWYGKQAKVREVVYG